VLTIAQHNETDPKCIGFSLQDWEQWLENGGYGLNNFVAMLKQVCNAALGDAAVATLWDYAQSIATAPEGIPRLIEYVQTTYPGLEQRMTTLEALALEEEQRIQDTAALRMEKVRDWIKQRWRAAQAQSACIQVLGALFDLHVITGNWIQPGQLSMPTIAAT
jgi:hypothetical protein